MTSPKQGLRRLLPPLQRAFHRFQQSLLHTAWRGLASALLGVSAVLCFAPFGLWWLAFPLWLGLYCLLRIAPSPRAAALTGWLFGCGFFLAGVSWVYVSLSVFGQMPPALAALATLLFCAGMAFYPALAAWVFRRWMPATPLRSALFFGVCWVLADVLRGTLFTGFPWLALGYSQHPETPLAGFAPILGVYGLSLLTAILSASLASWRLGVPLLSGLLVFGLGLQGVAWTQATGAPISVALVQGNIPQDVKFRPEHFRATLQTYLDLVAQNPAQLVVLPETAIPAFFEGLPVSYVNTLAQLAARQNGVLILGAPTGDGSSYRNSALAIGPEGIHRYNKHHLVPFGEFIPPGFAWFLALAQIPLGEFTAGPVDAPPFQVAGLGVAPNICYEDAFGEEIIRALPAANLLVNLSNTAWFGDSLAQPQHLQMSQMRALETGRPMLRATNTGMTAVIHPNGSVQAALPPFTPGVLHAVVQGYRGMTPYAQWGNWAVLIMAALILTSIALSRQRRW